MKKERGKSVENLEWLVNDVYEKQKQLDALRLRLVELMRKNSRHEFSTGNCQARLVPSVDVKGLRRTYSARVFRALCPPTPDLRALADKFQAVVDGGNGVEYLQLMSCCSSGFDLILEEKHE